jgi:hypothetical protein
LIARRQLKRVLADWSPILPGLFLYYSNRPAQPALRAFIDCLLDRDAGVSEQSCSVARFFARLPARVYIEIDQATDCSIAWKVARIGDRSRTKPKKTATALAAAAERLSVYIARCADIFSSIFPLQPMPCKPPFATLPAADHFASLVHENPDESVSRSSAGALIGTASLPVNTGGLSGTV